MTILSRPRPLIEKIGILSGLEVNPAHWSRGSTVTTQYFLDLYLVLVGQKYNGKKDKRGVAEALLIQVSGTHHRKNIINEDMFSKGSTVTNKYFSALLEALVAFKKINDDGYTYSVGEIDQSELEFVVNDFHEGSLEGRKLLVSHYRFERDKLLSLCAKRLARKKHPENLLVCEICKIIPEKKYSLDLVEAHHRVPLSELKKSTKVKPSDFAMLCPNCHRAVHKVMHCSMTDISTRLKSGQ
jgi:hypothetical protein